MKVIGKAQDKKNSALINFLDEGIIQRIWPDNRIEKIAQFDYFNFGVINHANVIGDLLYWTDGQENGQELGSLNPPRKLNIIRASAITNQYLANKLPTYDPAYNYTIVPPTPAPEVEYLGNLYVAVQDSTGQTPSNISLYWRLARTKFVTGEIVGFNGNCFQCLQDTTTQDPTHSANWKLIEYKHYDSFTLDNIMRGKRPPLQPTWSVITDGTVKKNELRDKIFQFRSRFIYDDNEKSTWSCMSTPTLLNLEYDGYYSDPCINNTILLSLQTGAKEVVRIQIACRINNGLWVLVDDLHKYTPTFGVIIASNTNYTYSFKNDIQTLPLDQIETNNLFSYVPQVSNCQELIQGNRLVDADITEGYDYPTVACALTPRYATAPQPVETALSVSYISTAYVFVMPTFDSLIKVSILKFIIPLSTTNKITIQYFPKNETTIGQVLDGIVLEFAKNGVTAIKVGLTLSVTIPSNGAALFSLINVPDRIGGLKYSSTLNPGIVFFDELKRSCSVYKLPKIDIQSVNDQVGGTTVSFLPVPVIDFSLAGTPPIQAYSYKFCHVDNRYAFLDIAIPTSYIKADSVKGIVTLDIDQAVIDYKTANPNSIIQPWSWVKGDRIRILGYSNYNSIEYLTSEFDLDLSIPIGTKVLYSFPYQNLNYSRNLLIEIYRDVPQNIDPTVYFECGQEYLITNPRTSIRAYGMTSGTIDMYDAFQRNNSQKNAYLYAWFYVGGGGLGALQIFDIAVPTIPQLISSTNTPLVNPRYMVVLGDYAYTTYTQSLQIWDVSNISAPVVTSTVTLDYDDSKTVRINAAYAYIVSGNHAKLTTVDVSVPSAPVKYTAISLTGGAGNEDICFRGTKAYSSGVLTGTIDVIDISNPQIPVLGTPITGLSSPRKLCVSGDYLFVTNSGANNLKIYNISGTPVLISTVASLSDCYAVLVQGNYAYVVNYGANSLSVIDISNINAPTVVGTVTVGTNPYDLAVAGRYVYVANFTSMNISVVDVSNPSAPSVIATTTAVDSYSSLSVSGISEFGAVESRNYSDLFKSEQGDLGRICVYSLEMKRQRIKGLKRWSGVYLQNTFKNDLSFNGYSDYDESNEAFGAITRIYEYGDILRVLQAKKITSFYLSKAVLNQAAQSGQEIVSTSTEVLGSLHQSTEPYGCVNPESVVLIGTTSFFADIDFGIVRQSESEPVVVSDIGLKNYIKNLFAQIKNHYPKIVGGYDHSKHELWYSIYAYLPTGEIKITLLFNEEEKVWKSFINFVDVNGNLPEMYGSIGLSLYAFNQGIGWLCEAGDIYSKFFGVAVQPIVNIIGKGATKSVFNSIKIISNKEWKSDNIYIFDDAEYVRMQSKLPKMVKKENYFYSPFLRNAITTNPTFNSRDLFNGDTLRGDTALIELKTIEPGLTQLYLVEVTTTPSL